MWSAWLGAAAAVLVAALPPPPEVVVRETKSFGTITIPHAKHLQARVACRSCHGSGRVGKVQFTPKAAHATCRNCHVEVSRGPVECRGCHVVAPKPEAAVAGQPGAAAGGDGGTQVAVRSFTVAPGSSHVGAPGGGRPLEPSIDEAPERTPRVRFSKTIEAGVLAAAGQRQRLAAGPTVQLTARSGPTMMQYGVSFAGARGDGRTQVLVGGGRSWEIIPDLNASAVVVGGLDATHSPVSMLPALGVRTGLEISGRSPWTLCFSAMGLADLARGEAGGERTDGVIFVGGATVGWRLP